MIEDVMSFAAKAESIPTKEEVGRVRISWASVPNRRYRLDQSHDLITWFSHDQSYVLGALGELTTSVVFPFLPPTGTGSGQAPRPISESSLSLTSHDACAASCLLEDGWQLHYSAFSGRLVC